MPVEIKILKDKKLKKIIHTIVGKANPEKIYLFGSRAMRTSHLDSDYDLLIIKKTGLSVYNRIVSIYKLFGLRNFSMDVLVYTPAEITKWKDVPSSFINHILKTGKLVYER